jgi:hypothetical protein
MLTHHHTLLLGTVFVLALPACGEDADDSANADGDDDPNDSANADGDDDPNDGDDDLDDDDSGNDGDQGVTTPDCEHEIEACQVFCNLVCNNCGDHAGQQNACDARGGIMGGGCDACVAAVEEWGPTCEEEGDFTAPEVSCEGVVEGTIEQGEDGVIVEVNGEELSWELGPGAIGHLDLGTRISYSVSVFNQDRGQFQIDLLDVQSAPSTHECDGAPPDARITFTPAGESTFTAMNGGACAVEVKTAGGPGGRFEGTFSGTLVAEGSDDLVLTNGSFAADIP